MGRLLHVLLLVLAPILVAKPCLEQLQPCSGIPQVHHFNWTVHYTKEDPDGFLRRMIIIEDATRVNQTVHFPGPQIEVCLNDTIDLYLENRLQTESISIHWHGIHQKASPWMDGVQQVTQYPVLPGQTFHYKFIADKVGTHWYHSHTGGQYTDGLLGMLIVRDPQDPNGNLSECRVLLGEWYHNDVIDTFDIFTEYRTLRYRPIVDFVSGLVNGKAHFNCTKEQINTSICTLNTTFERFVVKQKQTYRFRLVSAGSQFTYTFSIDNHTLTIVAMDGVYVTKREVDAIYVDIGQRYDVLVEMNQKTDIYWIRSYTSNSRFDKLVNEFNAVLQYEGASSFNYPTSKHIDPPNDRIIKDSSKLIPSTANTLDIALKPPLFTQTLHFKISCEETRLSECYINQHRYRMSPKPTLLSLNDGDPDGEFVTRLKQNTAVMVIIDNSAPIHHPLHFHGHDFYILGTGNDTDVNTTYNNDTHFSLLNFVDPPIRDTFKLPMKSWAVIGIVAHNPGSWLFHCHIVFDMEAGMAHVINIDGTLPPIPADYPITAPRTTGATPPSLWNKLSVGLIIGLALAFVIVVVVGVLLLRQIRKDQKGYNSV